MVAQAAEAPVYSGFTFGEVIAGHAQTQPDAVALHFDGETISYGVLNQRGNKVANALLAAGLKPGDRIAYLGKNSDRTVELTVGAAKAGVVVIPVIWRLAPPEIAFILEDSGAQMLFVDSALAETAKSARARMERIVQLDGDPVDPAWIAYDAWRDAAPDTTPDVALTPDDVVIQIYTSGTTGKPKGAMLTHANATRYRQYIDAANLPWLSGGTGETALLAMPYGHIAGIGVALLALHSAQQLIIHREFDPVALLDAVERYRLQRLFLVPAALQMLLALPQSQTTDFSSLRYFSYGASPIPVPLLEEGIRRLGCEFIQVYGMTETWGGVVALPPEDHDPARRHLLSSAGRAMPGVSIRIRDAEGNILPPGETGEVEINSPSNMVGYWNRDAATAEALIGDNWLKTGDAGYMDADGYLFLQDRIKDMIVSGAENVYPAEVESVIYGHPQVADVAVIGIPDDKWGEAVKAIVVRSPGTEPTAEEIIAYAREHLAGFKCPKSVDFIDALPRNPSGKILRRELREPFWAGRERRVN